jgi:hypothetical protein
MADEEGRGSLDRLVKDRIISKPIRTTDRTRNTDPRSRSSTPYRTVHHIEFPSRHAETISQYCSSRSCTRDCRYTHSVVDDSTVIVCLVPCAWPRNRALSLRIRHATSSCGDARMGAQGTNHIRSFKEGTFLHAAKHLGPTGLETQFVTTRPSR